MVNDEQNLAVQSAASVIPAELFKEYGGGWTSEISTALVDAVFSIQALYRAKDPNAGVIGRLQTFRREECAAVDDLRVLSSLGSDRIREVMGSGVSAGHLKAEAAVEAADGLIAAGVFHAQGFLDADKKEMKRIYTRVRGLGWVTFEYFSMLLGIPGVKADTMITRFVNNALISASLAKVDDRQARALIVEAHNETKRGKTLTHFEHAIWLYQSDLSASSRRK